MTTPLASAKGALARLGNNGRLIEQKGGIGHTTLSHASFCTARVLRSYWVEGKAPSQAHSLCQVDQVPFQPWSGKVLPDGE
jgi:hypothetical protein